MPDTFSGCQALLNAGPIVIGQLGGAVMAAVTRRLRYVSVFIFALVGLVAGLLTRAAPAKADDSQANLLAFENATGQLRTLNVAGAVDFDNPFFQDLGTNGRRCVSCHQPADGWTITPENVQARFLETNGADPIFRSNDGSDCEGVDSVHGDQAAAYSMLLSKGLIRVAMDVP